MELHSVLLASVLRYVVGVLLRIAPTNVLCGKKSARLPGFFVHILPYRGQLTHMCGPALVTLGGIHVEEITVWRRSLVDGEDVAPFDTESVNETWPVNEKPRLRLSLVYVA